MTIIRDNKPAGQGTFSEKINSKQQSTLISNCSLTKIITLALQKIKK